MTEASVFEGKKAVYFTLGCKLNFAETSTIGRLLKEMGVRTVRAGERADICVVNTCSVTEVADSQVGETTSRCLCSGDGLLCST